MSSLLLQQTNNQSSMATIIFCISLLIITLIATFALYIKKHSVGNPKKPPGPRGLPIIGNLLQLGEFPHRSLCHLASIYGPLMLLKLGQIPTYIVSSPSFAKEILKNHDIAFCSRPSLTVWQRLSYGGLDLAFSPYTSHWRQLKKLSVVEFFSNKRVLESMQHTTKQELDTMMSNIARASACGEAVNLSDMFLCLITNITCIMAFGERFGNQGECLKTEFDKLITGTIKLVGEFVVGDFFPCMQYVMNMVSGIQMRIEKNCKELDEFLERRLKENEGSNGDDFSSVLLRLHKDSNQEGWVTRDDIKAVLMNIFLGGTDTTAQTLVWAMSELIKNPRVLTKVQDEVRQVVKGKHMVEELDLQHLKYLNLVVKEVFRLHPPGPLLFPRECREASIIDKYIIPAKARVYINVWAIGRDPNTWENPNEFQPERFEDSNINYKGLHFEFIPLGGGRRICPGMSMGARMMELTLANILYSFNWSLPNGMSIEDLDFSEAFGIVVSKKVPLVVVPTPAK